MAPAGGEGLRQLLQLLCRLENRQLDRFCRGNHRLLLLSCRSQETVKIISGEERHCY